MTSADRIVAYQKGTIDIIEVVRSYVPHPKKSCAVYKGSCPFRVHRASSFRVHPEKGLYSCSGCGKSGDAISFVMDIERVGYREALLLLAERVGFKCSFEPSSKRRRIRLPAQGDA